MTISTTGRPWIGPSSTRCHWVEVMWQQPLNYISIKDSNQSWEHMSSSAPPFFWLSKLIMHKNYGNHEAASFSSLFFGGWECCTEAGQGGARTFAGDVKLWIFMAESLKNHPNVARLSHNLRSTQLPMKGWQLSFWGLQTLHAMESYPRGGQTRRVFFQEEAIKKKRSSRPSISPGQDGSPWLGEQMGSG